MDRHASSKVLPEAVNEVGKSHILVAFVSYSTL